MSMPAFEWFFGQLEGVTELLDQLPKSFDLQEITLFILKMAGLTISGITNIVTNHSEIAGVVGEQSGGVPGRSAIVGHRREKD